MPGWAVQNACELSSFSWTTPSESGENISTVRERGLFGVAFSPSASFSPDLINSFQKGYKSVCSKACSLLFVEGPMDSQTCSRRSGLSSCDNSLPNTAQYSSVGKQKRAILFWWQKMKLVISNLIQKKQRGLEMRSQGKFGIYYPQKSF